MVENLYAPGQLRLNPMINTHADRALLEMIDAANSVSYTNDLTLKTGINNLHVTATQSTSRLEVLEKRMTDLETSVKAIEQLLKEIAYG